MTARFRVALRAAAALGMALWLAACGGGDSGDPSPQPATVVIAVSESRIVPAIGGTEASGVFLVVRYVLANGADEDVRVSQDDFTLVAPDGTALARSKPAWTPGRSRRAATSLRIPCC